MNSSIDRREQDRSDRDAAEQHWKVFWCQENDEQGTDDGANAVARVADTHSVGSSSKRRAGHQGIEYEVQGPESNPDDEYTREEWKPRVQERHATGASGHKKKRARKRHPAAESLGGKPTERYAKKSTDKVHAQYDPRLRQ